MVKNKRKLPIEYCDQCPFSETEEDIGITLGYWCTKVEPSKEILYYDEGIIPDWCPLPKESNQSSTTEKEEK